MLGLGQALSQGLMLRNFLNKMGITNLPNEMDKLKFKLFENQSEGSFNTKRRKVSEDETSDSPILIRISDIESEAPQVWILEDPKTSPDQEFEKLDKEDEIRPKSEECEDKFRIPDHSSHVSKSRTNSEKSGKQKRLTIGKMPSIISVTTQATPTIKDKVTPVGIFKDGKSFEFTNASVQNNEHENELNVGSKVDDFMTSKLEIPSFSQDVKRVRDEEMLIDNPVLNLEARENLEDVFHDDGDFKNIDDYHADNLHYVNPDTDKAKFEIDNHHSIEGPHHDAENDAIYGNFGNSSIDDFQHKANYHYEDDFLSGGFMNDPHHDDFHLASDLP